MARGRGHSNRMTGCPACGAEIYFRKAPRISQRVTCRQCSSLLEVLEHTPLELDWAFEDPLDEIYWDPRQDDSTHEEWDFYQFDEDEQTGDSEYVDTGNGRASQSHIGDFQGKDISGMIE